MPLSKKAHLSLSKIRIHFYLFFTFHIDRHNSLSYTKWNCKYHIVFAPKYRRQVIYGKLRKDIGAILRKLCEFKGVEIIEANALVKIIFIC